MQVVLTNHAKARLAQRGVTEAQVIECLGKAKPVRTYDGWSCEARVKGDDGFLKVVFVTEANKVTVKTVLWRGRSEANETKIRVWRAA